MKIKITAMRKARYDDLIAKYENGRVSDGLLQTMKIMTAIPPSSDTAPNCLVLSQLYPSF